MRRRVLLAVTIAVLVAAPFGARLAIGRLERSLAGTVRRMGAPHGLSVRDVRLSWPATLRLEGVTLQPARLGAARLTLAAAHVRWRLLGGSDVRSHVDGVTLQGLRLAHGPLLVEWPQGALDVMAWSREAGAEHLRLRQAFSGGEADITWPGGRGGARPASVSLSRLDLSTARVSWGGETVLDPGSWSGRLSLTRAGERLESEGMLAGEAVRVALPPAVGMGSGDYGSPTAVAFDWSVVRDDDSIEVRRAAARLDGLALDARGRLQRWKGDRQVTVQLSASSDLGAALRTTGVLLPASLDALPRDRFGTAWFDLSVRGSLADPAGLRVKPRLRFESAPESVRALHYLLGPFRYTPAEAEGVVIDVRPGAPDFVPLGSVPPLFVQALLMSEDAGFFGHPGVDVAEIPIAWATNVERGRAARGASTITQQLAKNLFLSSDKSYGRKVTEAALALVLDAAVPKTRLLEIYLNVIEWGPGCYGLGPAARHYFGKAPGQLTPREMAFLVCLVPSPVRYHQAHAAGRVGPGMDQLMANLLEKLRAAGALSDEQHAAALAEELAFRPES